MSIDIFDLSIKFNNQNKKYNFKFPYINNQTNYENLFDIISILFPNEKICSCFKYNINNNGKIIEIQKDKKINEYFENNIPRISLHIYNQYLNKECYYHKYYQKSKKEIINNIKGLENKEINFEKSKNYLEQKINDLKNEISKLRKENDDLKNLIEKKNNIATQLNKINKNIEDFYDVIIDIKSIKDINKGWKIKISDKGEKKYNEFKNEKVIKIGVIGNINKGKSFILSKISKINLPYGIRTEGLRIKYPELEGYRKIILLDSAGLETPVLKDEEYYKNKENENEYFREKSREKLITELFLQNYIINNSDILILVVGILSYSEQKLINRIKI